MSEKLKQKKLDILHVKVLWGILLKQI